VEVEIPLADSWADAREVDRVQTETGLVCMAGHTRRFNPSHQWIHKRIAAGELSIEQMDVQTYFFRRKNLNALGEPRSWTDHLLWHHAAHTVDLFQYQAGEDIQIAHAVEGPMHPELVSQWTCPSSCGRRPCASARCRSASTTTGRWERPSAISATTARTSPGTTTWSPAKEPLNVSKVDVSTHGIELQDRECIAAIREGREANSSVVDVLPCYRVLGELETELTSEN
jgi:2-hydroxy-4-carboxymuconate semialdehyde hemiacetal dehydrogenase